MSAIERRPGPDGFSHIEWPKEWGAPPATSDKRALAAWAKLKVIDGKIARHRGERVAWLNPETR